MGAKIEELDEQLTQQREQLKQIQDQQGPAAAALEQAESSYRAALAAEQLDEAPNRGGVSGERSAVERAREHVMALDAMAAELSSRIAAAEKELRDVRGAAALESLRRSLGRAKAVAHELLAGRARGLELAAQFDSLCADIYAAGKQFAEHKGESPGQLGSIGLPTLGDADLEGSPLRTVALRWDQLRGPDWSPLGRTGPGNQIDPIDE